MDASMILADSCVTVCGTKQPKLPEYLELLENHYIPNLNIIELFYKLIVEQHIISIVLFLYNTLTKISHIITQVWLRHFHIIILYSVCLLDV